MIVCLCVFPSVGRRNVFNMFKSNWQRILIESALYLYLARWLRLTSMFDIKLAGNFSTRCASESNYTDSRYCLRHVIKRMHWLSRIKCRLKPLGTNRSICVNIKYKIILSRKALCLWSRKGDSLIYNQNGWSWTDDILQEKRKLCVKISIFLHIRL